MKRPLLLIGLGILLAAGCTKQEQGLNESLAQTVISASYENVGSKSAMSDAGGFTWLQGDKISVKLNDDSYCAFTLADASAGHISGSFSAVIPSDLTVTGPGYYPSDLNPSGKSITIPASRAWKADETYNTMYGQLSSGSIAFKQLGGIVKVTLNSVPTGADKFVMTTPGCKINGTFTISDDETPVITAAESSDAAEQSISYTFDALTEAADMVFYVPVPVGTYSSGFSIAAYAGTKKVADFKGSSAQTVGRRDLLIMPALTVSTINGGGEGGQSGAAANTYVAAPGSTVQFALVKGNSEEAVAAASLKLLWQDAIGLVSGTPSIQDGKGSVSFAEGKEGNAVVAGLDAEGNVLWSWLFWVAANAPQDVTIGDYAFMDRNIGALNLDEKSELSVGVTFQYGRKDAFPSIKFGEYALRKIYDAAGEPVTITIENNSSENNIENAIKNPTIFYNNKYYSGAKHGYSWITTDATTFGAEKLAALWENEGKKSVYDPCPAGYQVAPLSAWDAVKAAGNVQEIWDDSYETFDSAAIGTNEKYAAGNRKKVQFRGCIYSGLRLTISGEINSNSTAFSFANCIGKPLPTAEVWMAEIDPSYKTSATASTFRGMAAKVNTSGNGNYDDISAIKVNTLSTAGKYTLNYALPVRCVREK